MLIPWAARTFMTVSQPRSRDLIRSLSSTFSRSRAFSRSVSSCRRSSTSWSDDVFMPPRNWRFSSSSSATRRSSVENCVFRLSREFCAAIRLRCARASLRSSGVISSRGRLRELDGCESMRPGEEKEPESDEGDGGVSRDGSTKMTFFDVVLIVQHL